MTIRDELSRAEFSGQVTYGWLDCFTINPSGKRTRKCDRIIQRQAERLVEKMEKQVKELQRSRRLATIRNNADAGNELCEGLPVDESKIIENLLAFASKFGIDLRQLAEDDNNDNDENEDIIFDTIEACKSGGYSARKSLKRDYGEV